MILKSYFFFVLALNECATRFVSVSKMSCIRLSWRIDDLSAIYWLIRDLYSSSGAIVDFLCLNLRRLQWLEGTVYSWEWIGAVLYVWLPLRCLYDAGVLTNARRRISSKGIPLFLRFLWAFVLQSIAPAAVPYSMTHFQLMQFPSLLRNWDYCCWTIAMVAGSISTRAHTIKITHAQVLCHQVSFSCEIYVSRINSPILFICHGAFCLRLFSLHSHINRRLSDTTFKWFRLRENRFKIVRIKSVHDPKTKFFIQNTNRVNFLNLIRC